MRELGQLTRARQEERWLPVSWRGRWECLHFVNNKTFSICHVAQLFCVRWCSDASHLVPDRVWTNGKGLWGQIRWEAGSLNQNHIWYVICYCSAQQDFAPTQSINLVQSFLQERNFSFWLKHMWQPFSPDVLLLDFAFSLRFEAKECTLCHPNIYYLRTSVDQKCMALSTDYVVASCLGFRHRFEGIILSNGSYIE